MKGKKFLSLLLALILAFSLAVPALADEPADGAPTAIVILHTNDVHGAIEGYAQVAAVKDYYEAQGAYVLLVDAGDFIQGTTAVSTSEGATAVELMNMAGYDLAVPGNHEFDYGYENLKTLAEAAEFPILAANIQYEGGAAFDATKIFEAPGGTKIGFFGLTTPETATKAHPAKIQGVTFLAEEELYACAQAQVDALKAENCDYIICVGHLGIDEESVGNRSIDVLEHVDGIDVFIDGHSHSTLKDIEEATGGTGRVGEIPDVTYILSTGTKLVNVGVAVLPAGETTTVTHPLPSNPTGEWGDVGHIYTSLPVEELTTTPVEEIAARAAEIAAEIEAEYGAVFAKTEVDLNGARDPGNRTEETNLGNLITDAMLWKANSLGEQVDVAITNGGGIRASIPAGDITKNDINTVLPFGNTLSIVKVTGAELLEALEASTYCTPTAVGGFPQVSGMAFAVDTSAAFDQGEQYPDSTYYAPASINRVQSVVIGAKRVVTADGTQIFVASDDVTSVVTSDGVEIEPPVALDPEKVYTVATNDFLAAGGDTYYAFAAASVNYDLGVTLDEVVMEYITEELGGVVPASLYDGPQGRIRVKYAGVEPGAWYVDAARTVMDRGLMSSTGNGFDPSAQVSRASVYQTLYNMENRPEVTAGSVTDVEGMWYADCVNWAASVGLFEGTEFGTDSTILRGDIRDLLAAYGELKEVDYTNLMKGNEDGDLMLDQPVDRAQYAQVLANLLAVTPDPID